MDLVADTRRRDELEYTAQAIIATSRSIVTAYMRRSLWRYAGRVTAPTF